jgi:tellurite resistance protein
MSEDFDLAVISRVAPEDRIPFVKALAGIAAADDEVTLDEKQAVMNFAKAWDLSEADVSATRDILRQGTTVSMDSIVDEFNQPNTSYLLLEELVRIAHADGTYGEAEKDEVKRIAVAAGLVDSLEDVEEFVERGLVWGSTESDDDGRDYDALKDYLDRDDDEDEYDLSDIPTADTDELDRLVDEKGMAEDDEADKE